MNIRKSRVSDLKSIAKLHIEAFSEEENEVVAKLALDLVVDDSRIVSLVATEDDELIGHVVFSPARIVNNKKLSSYILAPLAISPSVQKRGIGGMLVRHGLETLSARHVDAVFVLGDPNYYCRSGFHSSFDIKPPYSLPYPEAWQAIELTTGALQGVSGTLECVPVLMSPELW